MLTYRTGAAGAPSAAAGMADHLLEQTLTPEQAALAQYYQQGLAAASPGVTVAEPRRDLDPRLAVLLGLDPNRAPTRDEIAHLLNGSRTDGTAIPSKQVQTGTESLAEILGLDAARVPRRAQIAAILDGNRADGEALREKVPGVARSRFLELYGVPREREASPEELAHILGGRRAGGAEQRLAPLSQGLAASRARIGYIDLCWSADKSVSLAWAFAPTEAERAIIAEAHRDAVSAALLCVEAEIGQARKGKAGREGREPGQIGWVRFDHYASRPTVEVPRINRVTGEAYTELVTLKVAGDPQLHTHVAIPNVVLTEEGRVGGLDLQRLEGRIKEFGAYYQAHLATNLRRHGVAVALDPATGAARLTAIPERVRDAFSKRTQQGTEAARRYARAAGLDWDRLDSERRIALLKQGVQGDPRQVKQDDLSDWASWRRQARDLGWQPASVLRPEAIQPLPDRVERLERAYAVGRDLLDRELQRRAVLDGADARVAAARGLIASGVEAPEEIAAVTRAFAARGVRHEGRDVSLIWGLTTDLRGQEAVKLTTTLHADREAELVDLARAAAGDRRGALPLEAIAAAVARSDYDFSTAQGLRQRVVMEQLGQGGRLAVAIGVAGAGKTTLLAPLVAAWTAEERVVHGAALAWRQSEDLAAAGIARERLAAMSVFLDRARKGRIALDALSVVVVDELGLLGTRQLLDLLRLQKERGFQLVAVGDPKQCQAIEAGPVIGLLRRALGPETIPELLTTIRQSTERERETSLLFREGQAAEALARKREDGTALLVPGGYAEAVAQVAALWQARRAAHAHDPGFTLTVSAPTNADAREIAAAIRLHRRAAGELGPDLVVVQATDQTGAQYDLPLAVGDRVRLFARTNAAYADRGRGIIGNNGSVLEVRAIAAAGLTLRNAQGREGLVKWETLRDPESQRIKLSYGDVLSIDATQGLTSSEHIEAMPAGTQAVNAYKAYTQASRHREQSWLVTSEGAERREVAARRPLGDPRPIRAVDVWANMARNLARAPEKASALDFLEQARDLRRGAVQSLQAGLQPGEQRRAEGREPFTLQETLQRRREAAPIAKAAVALDVIARQEPGLARRLSRIPQGAQKAVREAVQAAAPLLRQAIEAIREQRALRALNALRAELLAERMENWRKEQQRTPEPEREADTLNRYRRAINTMTKAEIERTFAERRRRQEEITRQRERRPQWSGPSRGR